MSEQPTIRVLGCGGDYEDWPNPNYKPQSSLAPALGSGMDCTNCKYRDREFWRDPCGNCSMIRMTNDRTQKQLHWCPNVPAQRPPDKDV